MTDVEVTYVKSLDKEFFLILLPTSLDLELTFPRPSH